MKVLADALRTQTGVIKEKNVFNLNLRIPVPNVWTLLQSITGNGFQKGLNKYFKINPSGTVDFDCVCWLYMWATASWNRVNTATQVQRVWQQIFGFPVNWLNRSVFKPAAKTIRDRLY
jgi:hypothetical protein